MQSNQAISKAQKAEKRGLTLVVDNRDSLFTVNQSEEQLAQDLLKNIMSMTQAIAEGEKRVFPVSRQQVEKHADVYFSLTSTGHVVLELF